ncbi:MAG: hypothetical protein B7Z72_13180 [Gemmatimonadetes bacterium 21-71-4]|nr:MAG: hypothetical protein B7Z72_13180 [Gemmatimonadetes bacterium 21-71-4]
MPQRDPLSPPLLAVAGVLAALPAAWLALAADACASGAAGSLAGFAWAGLSLTPSFTLTAGLARAGSHAPAAWALVLLAGPLGSACLGLAAHAIAQTFRGLAWLRVMAFQWVAFAMLRLPALLIAAVVPGGRGPVNDLYGQLGEPESGRWAVAVLAFLALGGAAALVSRLAVGAGRGWMRVDGRGFRRHLVRVVAGYPALAALAGWSAQALWASPGWMVSWLVLTLVALHGLTP